jgi:uncharacterized protein (DUF885 family)
MKKTIYVSLITALTLVSVFAFSACSNSNETASTPNNSSEMMKDMNHNSGGMDHGDSKDMKTVSTDFSAQKNSQTSGIIDAYEQTKIALDVNDNTKAAEGAKAMLAALEKFDISKLKESQRKEYKEIYETAKEHAEHITKSELDHQKEHFESLTKDLKDILAVVNADNKDS